MNPSTQNTSPGGAAKRDTVPATTLHVATALATALYPFATSADHMEPGLSFLEPSPRALRRASERSFQQQAHVDLHNTLKAAREAGRYSPEDLDRQMEALRGVTRVRVDTRYHQLLRREQRSGLDDAALREFEAVSRMVWGGHGGQYLQIPAQAPVGKAAQRRLQAERAMSLGEVYGGKAPATAWASAPCRACGRPQGVPNAACLGHVSNGKVIKRRRGTVIRLVAIGV